MVPGSGLERGGAQALHIINFKEMFTNFQNFVVNFKLFTNKKGHAVFSALLGSTGFACRHYSAITQPKKC
jgi:hypothetical protein